jgi:hypothetical protein
MQFRSGAKRVIGNDLNLRNVFDPIREVQNQLDKLTAEQRETRAELRGVRELIEEER